MSRRETRWLVTTATGSVVPVVADSWRVFDKHNATFSRDNVVIADFRGFVAVVRDDADKGKDEQ